MGTKWKKKTPYLVIVASHRHEIQDSWELLSQNYFEKTISVVCTHPKYFHFFFQQIARRALSFNKHKPERLGGGCRNFSFLGGVVQGWVTFRVSLRPFCTLWHRISLKQDPEIQSCWFQYVFVFRRYHWTRRLFKTTWSGVSSVHWKWHLIMLLIPLTPSSIVIIPQTPSSIVIITNTPSSIVIISKKQWNGTKYSTVDLVNFKGCLPQNLLRPNLNILSQITPPFGISVTKIFSPVYFIKSRPISFEYSLSYTHEKKYFQVPIWLITCSKCYQQIFKKLSK